jgi:cysteine desulfurase
MNDPSRTTAAAAPVVYLDHAASTPMYDEAITAVAAQMRPVGNPSSLHAAGRAARRAVEESRERIAAALGARPSEVVFTSGGTESDNLAVKGLFWARRDADPRRTRILSTAVEHHAVLDPLRWLVEHEHADVELLPVDELGRVRLDALAASLARDPDSVALVSVMWANNEVGTVQPVAEVVRLAHAHGIPVHTDAVQAVGVLPVDFAAGGVDLMTLTAHKLGGPLGVGALVARRELALTPLLHGGGQERDVRSGTLDAPALVGFATALEIATARRDELVARISALREDLVRRVRAVVPAARLNGDPVCDVEHRLPGNAHLSFPGCEGDSLLMLLDAQGIAASTGSACSAGVPQPSHVLLAMGRSDEQARSSLRFSLGHTSTPADVDALVAAIGPAVERALAAGALGSGRATSENRLAG